MFISSLLIYNYTQKHKRLSNPAWRFWYWVLGWFHFLDDDPTHWVPACVGISLLVPSTARPHIEGYIHSALRDYGAVALNGGCTNDVPSTARVNRGVNWHGALCTVECNVPSAASTGWNNPHVSLIDNSQMSIAALFDKWAFLEEFKKTTAKVYSTIILSAFDFYGMISWGCNLFPREGRGPWERGCWRRRDAARVNYHAQK